MSTQRPPSVDVLARSLAGESGLGDLPHPLVVAIVRSAIDESRTHQGLDPADMARGALREIAARRPQRIINATGVLLHTNLGRAPLHPEAASVASAVASGYGNVEFDLLTGARGGRHTYIDQLLCAVTGAEAGLAVNNNAGALLLCLAALAAPGKVLVSRGELIEIGGSFRLPELMAASGADLLEVGTTNRTRAADYAARMDEAELVLKVHPSNYRVEGFAEEVGYRGLAKIAHDGDTPFVADVGSGLLDVRTPWLAGPPPAWLAGEPGVRQTLETGADLVLFSGDKLLGGPQAGLIVGSSHLVGRMAKHPMMRALRLDGPTMAALVVTLELYGSGRGGEIPFWRMVSLDDESLERRLDNLRSAIAGSAEVVTGASLPGAGSVPGETIPTPILAVGDRPDQVWRRLLDADPPILTRRHEGRLVVDLRTVDPEDDPHLIAALA